MSPFALLLLACADPAPEPPPNFFVIDIDNFRADRLKPQGEANTVAPTLQGLADRGVAFTAAYTNGGWTHPAVASFLTGRWHPLSATQPALPMGVSLGRSLPEILGTYGYTTVAFWGRTAPSQVPNLQVGFARNVLDEPRGSPMGTNVSTWLASAPTEPFFAYVHEIDLHRGYEPTATPEQIGHGYDSILASYDAIVARYLQALDAAKLKREVVIVLYSDHGEEIFEHLGYGHCLLYDAILHVPLVIVDPGAPGARTVTTTVQTVDLAPTILARAGVPTDQAMVGQSFLGLWKRGGGDYTARDVYSLTDGENVSIRTDRYKLLTRLKDATFSPQGVPVVPAGAPREIVTELYDLRADPGEKHDLSTEQPDVRADLGAKLDAWKKEREAYGAPSLPPEVRDAVRARGYWDLVNPDRGDAPPAVMAPDPPNPQQPKPPTGPVNPPPPSAPANPPPPSGPVNPPPPR